VKVATIVGARPQFVKAAAFSQACGDSGAEETIIHTGQHYDAEMSEVFFQELNLAAPKYNLGLGGGTHGAMTGRMLEKIEEVLLKEEPDWVIVYGDTNSTLAGALAAAKLHMPVAHVEAGLRSFNKAMPEELNRILTDHVSTRLFCPTSVAVRNLHNEGLCDGVCHVGDIMYDAAVLFGHLAEQQSKILEMLRLRSREYGLATVHRAENTDDPVRLNEIFDAFVTLAGKECPLILPLHPRTANLLAKSSIGIQVQRNRHLRLIDPVSFLDMVMLEKHARIILTDSGGVQKEAYFHGVPCITLRDETEWLETVEAGWNQIVGAKAAAIIAAVDRAAPGQPIGDYGDGDSRHKILRSLQRGTRPTP
jgi:UDP-GlcNAc3NAcA epimerase